MKLPLTLVLCLSLTSAAQPDQQLQTLVKQLQEDLRLELRKELDAAAAVQIDLRNQLQQLELRHAEDNRQLRQEFEQKFEQERHDTAAKLKELEDKVDMLCNNIMLQDWKLVIIGEQVGRAHAQLMAWEGRVDGMRSQIDYNHQVLDDVIKSVDQQDERIDILESDNKGDLVDSRLANIESQMSDMSEVDTRHKQDICTIKDEVDSLQARVSLLQTNGSGIVGEIKAISDRVAALEKRGGDDYRFLAANSGSDVTESAHDVTGGVWTAPQDGVYLLSSSVRALQEGPSNLASSLQLNGTPVASLQAPQKALGHLHNLQFSVELEVKAGQEVKVTVNGIVVESRLSGRLVEKTN